MLYYTCVLFVGSYTSLLHVVCTSLISNLKYHNDHTFFKFSFFSAQTDKDEAKGTVIDPLVVVPDISNIA